MRVYHFTKTLHGLDAIRHRRLKLARISELNDPFEFLQVASKNPKTRARYQYVKRALSEYMGLLCFSENWRNPVQWSHYAEAHRGICLGFDVAPSAEMRKVRYVKNRISPNLRAMKAMGEAAIKHMLDLLTVSFEHWQYEQEHRLFARLNDKDQDTGLYFFEFGPSKGVELREVIVGALSQTSPEQVIEALGDIGGNVVSQKARLAFRTFEVVRQRNQDLWRPSRRRVGLREPSFESLVDQALRTENFSIPQEPLVPADDKRPVRRKMKKSFKRAAGDQSRSADHNSKSKKIVKKGDNDRAKRGRKKQ
jgi:hypothetical protein